MATLIQLRRDTAANWSSNNPILSSGEIGIATDLQQFKIGNSASSWNQLEYVNAIPSQYLSLIAASANFLTKTDAGIIYAPLGSASFVGTPTAPTATAGTNTQQIATTAFVRTEVTNLIDSAPGALDTLNELAAALGDDPNYAVSTASYIATKLDINNASATYLSISNAALTYVPISASSNIVDNYIPISSSYAYLTRDDASSLYIPITASGPYLTELEASALYIPISASANVVENYIPISSSYAYLTRSDAENTYIPISSSAEYLTESEAANLYIPISASSEYLTESEALGIYVPISASSAFLNAETLDGQDGSFYLDWFNITSKPNVTIGIELTGSTNGSGSVTLSQLNNGQVSISTNTGFAQSASFINWSGITDAPDPIIGLSLSGNTVGAASVTLNNLTNGQIELVTRTEFAETASSIAISGVVNLEHELNSSASAIGQRLTIENASATYRPLNAAVDADTLDGYDSSFFINSSSAVQEKNGNFTFHGTLTVNDLVISGSALTLSTTNLALTDSLVQLSHEQYNTDSVDIGIIGSYGDGTTSSAGHYHTSFARDASQSKWKLLENGPAPVNNVIDYSDPSVEYGVLQLGAIEVSSSAVVTNLNADMLDGQQGSYYAPLDSPAFTGTPTAPTASVGTNSTQIATTAFVYSMLTGIDGGTPSSTYEFSIDGGSVE